MNRHRIIARIGCLAVATATVAVTGAGTASAAVPGLERVEVRTLDNSAPVKSAYAPCPAGKRVIGGGGHIVSGGGQVVITNLTPLGSSFFVRAVEDQDGTTSDWGLRAYAICADPLPGLQVVTSSIASTSSRTNGSEVWCPTGKKLFGAGAAVAFLAPYAEFAGGPVALTGLYPHASLAVASFRASEDVDGNPNPWRLTMYGICADPVAGLQRAAWASGALNLESPKWASVDCPSGTRVIGPGGLIDIYGNDDVSLSKGQIVGQIAPNSTLTTVRVTGYAGQSAVGQWRAVAFAICATP